MNKDLLFIEDKITETIPLQEKQTHYPRTYYFWLKRCFDLISSVLGLVLFAIPMGLIALMIKIEDGGNVFYNHERIGKNGKKIKIYKFRSMKMNADKHTETLSEEQLLQYQKEYKVENDPRVTKIGSFIRKISMDELPQLLNILKGELSLVGPRPLLEEETFIYGKYRDKLLSAKPGLTGFWQAYARNEATYADGKRQRMEMYYIDHRSVWFDIKIVFKTFTTIFNGR